MKKIMMEEEIELTEREEKIYKKVQVESFCNGLYVGSMGMVIILVILSLCGVIK